MSISLWRTLEMDPRLAEEAVAWMENLERDAPAFRESFTTWLLQSPAHVEAFLQVSTTNSICVELARHGLVDELNSEAGFEGESSPLLDQLAMDGDAIEEVTQSGFALHDKQSFPRVRYEPKRWFSQWYSFGAAACAAAVAALLLFWAIPQLRPHLPFETWRHYSAPIGEQRMVHLDDGSTLYLEPGSTVESRFEADRRELRLLVGGAMFQVAHDKARPFRVHSGETVTRAVGTHFRVNFAEGKSVVAVVEGVVEVSHEAPHEKRLAQTVRVSAGKQVSVGRRGDFSALQPAPADLFQLWNERRLAFVNAPLYLIADELNRYNKKRKMRVDEKAGEAVFSAVIPADDLDLFAELLRKDGKFDVQVRGDEVVVGELPGARAAGAVAHVASPDASAPSTADRGVVTQSGGSNLAQSIGGPIDHSTIIGQSRVTNNYRDGVRAFDQIKLTELKKLRSELSRVKFTARPDKLGDLKNGTEDWQATLVNVIEQVKKAYDSASGQYDSNRHLFSAESRSQLDSQEKRISLLYSSIQNSLVESGRESKTLGEGDGARLKEMLVQMTDFISTLSKATSYELDLMAAKSGRAAPNSDVSSGESSR